MINIFTKMSLAELRELAVHLEIPNAEKMNRQTALKLIVDCDKDTFQHIMNVAGPAEYRSPKVALSAIIDLSHNGKIVAQHTITFSFSYATYILGRPRQYQPDYHVGIDMKEA